MASIWDTTDGLTEYVLDQWRKGVSVRAIATRASKRFGITIRNGAISGKLHRMGQFGSRSQKTAEGASVASGANLPIRPIPIGELMSQEHEPIGCRYIYGDVHNGDWWYCQQDQASGSPYCEHHHKLCRYKASNKSLEWVAKNCR